MNRIGVLHRQCGVGSNSSREIALAISWSLFLIAVPDPPQAPHAVKDRPFLRESGGYSALVHSNFGSVSLSGVEGRVCKGIWQGYVSK